MATTSPPLTQHLADRAVIRLSGDDVHGFLQGLVTNDVSAEHSVWAGLLTPQGKVLFDFFIWPDRDDFLIDCEANLADSMIRRLSMYRLRRAIIIALDANAAVFWSATEPDFGAKYHNSDMVPLPIGIRPDPRLPALGWRWLSAPARGDASAAYRAHRLSLGVAEGAAELGADKHLWLECNAAELNGVSFTKGCYVGQENTARMNWRAKVNRRIVVVPLDQADAKRQVVAYPDLNWSVEHRRVEDITSALAPDWMQSVLTHDDAADVQT
jgi:tRNA-modifying protein YgfZ